MRQIGDKTPVTADIATGTLDLPEIMEPDIHEYIESKISWVLLPEGAKTCKGPFDYREHWPKSSLKRLEVAIQKVRERERAKASTTAAAINGQDAEEEKEADKTPTAQTPDEKDELAEDDEEFERRYRETEQALQKRLEQLSLRLEENEKVQGDDLRTGDGTTTKNIATANHAGTPKAPISEN
ncbi:hypothetical protein N0V90_001423 [Kalmusia sp. IMI 367209]|nr:hypothetical protein N0V90_001423 [Kalmusia sp. IMI 367209]